MAFGDNPFKFNLITKPKEELEMVADRDSSTMYAVLLVFFGSLVYLALILLQNFVISPREQSLTAAITNKEQTIASYNIVKSNHGELFIKSKSLTPVLSKNIDPSEIFRVTSEMVKSNPSLAIESYSREKSGAFVFSVISRSFTEVTDLLKNTQAISGVSNVFVRSATATSSATLVRTVIALNIDAIKSQAQ